jgi:hypothetical protein
LIDGEGEKDRLRAGEAIQPSRYKKHTTKNMKDYLKLAGEALAFLLILTAFWLTLSVL